MLTANVLYGINYSIGKTALASFPAFFIVGCRVLVAAVVFLIVEKILVHEKTDKKDRHRFFIAALFGVAINQLLFFKGLSLTSEMHSAFLMIATPLLVLIAGWIILREKITGIKLLGICTGAAGVILLVMSNFTGKQTAASVSGDICIFINAASYAFFLVYAKPLMQRYHPLRIAAGIFLWGTPMVFPFALSEAASVTFSEISAIAWWSLAFVIIGATILAYLLNLYGLHYGDASLVSIYIYTQPVLATAIAWIMGRDSMQWMQAIAAILVCTGVALVSGLYPKKRPVEVHLSDP